MKNQIHTFLNQQKGMPKIGRLLVPLDLAVVKNRLADKVSFLQVNQAKLDLLAEKPRFRNSPKYR